MRQTCNVQKQISVHHTNLESKSDEISEREIDPTLRITRN